MESETNAADASVDRVVMPSLYDLRGHMPEAIDCPSCGQVIEYEPEGKNYPCERCGVLWQPTKKTSSPGSNL